MNSGRFPVLFRLQRPERELLTTITHRTLRVAIDSVGENHAGTRRLVVRYRAALHLGTDVFER
jgi:hypothetical protein